MDTPLITLERFAHTHWGTFGTLTIDDWHCVTVERPWLQNAPNISCIPVGRYALRLRDSGVVERSTHGAFDRGWEVCDVVDRSYIMLHPGNTMDDLEGCIAVGRELGFINGKWAVTDSQATFSDLMARLARDSEWRLAIHNHQPTP